MTEALILLYHTIKKGKKIREFEKYKMQVVKKAINKIANANDKYERPKFYKWYDYSKVLDEEDICER